MQITMRHIVDLFFRVPRIALELFNIGTEKIFATQASITTFLTL